MRNSRRAAARRLATLAFKAEPLADRAGGELARAADRAGRISHAWRPSQPVRRPMPPTAACPYAWKAVAAPRPWGATAPPTSPRSYASDARLLKPDIDRGQLATASRRLCLLSRSNPTTQNTRSPSLRPQQAPPPMRGFGEYGVSWIVRPRALPSCWRRHLPPTAFAWLPMPETGSSYPRHLGRP